MLNQKLWQVIFADLYRYEGRVTVGSFIRCFIKSPGFRYSYYLRKASHYRRRRGALSKIAFVYYKLMLNRYRFRYGFEIPDNAQIGPGLYLGHFGGVVISPVAVLGSNVNVAHGVTIGMTSRGERRGAPTIGDRVWMGTNAVIVGKIRIGNDALISPGAFVNFDVPPRAVVLGNPGKIVSYKGSEGYVNRIAPAETFTDQDADDASVECSRLEDQYAGRQLVEREANTCSHC